jgi:hypothetical protein
MDNPAVPRTKPYRVEVGGMELAGHFYPAGSPGINY